MKLNPAVFWALIFLTTCLIWAWFSSRLILNAPRIRDYVTPDNLKIPFEKIEFKSGRRKISGWFITSQKNTSKTIIICHGWGASKGDVLYSTFFLHQHYNLLYFDFTNHGESGGNKTSMGKYESEDMLSAVKYLKEEKPSLSAKIGVFGFSMGGVAAIYAASKDKRINAVVAESPFDSFNEITAHHAKLFLNLPRHPLVVLTILGAIIRLGHSPERYSPMRNISKVSPTAVLLLATSGDENIPVEAVKRVYEKAEEPKELVVFDSHGHGTAYIEHTDEYKKTITRFFSKNL